MHARSLVWARHLLLAGVAAATVFVIPAAWYPLQVGKIAIFAIFLAASVVLFATGGGLRTFFRLPGSRLALLVGALPLVYAASWFVSTDRTIALLGYGIESDTVVFVLIGAIAFLVAFALVRTVSQALSFGAVLAGTLAAAVVFQFVSIFFGSTAVPFQTFADRSVNLIGKWNDLGLLASLLAMGILVWFEYLSVYARPTWRSVLYGLLGLAGGLLAIVNFTLAWVLLGIFSGLLAGVAFMARAPGVRAGSAQIRHALPLHALLSLGVSIVFLLAGASISTGITRLLPVSALEVRPAYDSTLSIVAQSHASSTKAVLLGTGPGTFLNQWLLHKPTEVNRTQFWNLNFLTGFSVLTTAYGTVGILGATAWLLPLLLVLLGLLRAMRLSDYEPSERACVALLGFGSMFLWASMVSYAPSQNVLLLAFVISGAAFGLLWQLGRTVPTMELHPVRGKKLALHLLLVVTISGLAIFPAVVAGQRLLSRSFGNQALIAIGNGDLAAAELAAARANRIEPATFEATRAQVELGAYRLQQIANNQNLSASEAQSQFGASFGEVVRVLQASITAHPNDYRPYALAAQVYELLAALRAEGAAEQSVAAYAAAIQYDPYNPEYPLGVARVAARQGNREATERALTQSLTLKPDYTDAILFVVDLEVANKNVPGAIRAAEAAAQSAPGVSSIWFKLGVLYYTNKDHRQAVQALEQALALQPDYANAQYFLGLAYYEIGRTADAARQFEQLSVTNPDNEEVKQILNNLKFGRSPFAGAPQDAPASRAPIEQ